MSDTNKVEPAFTYDPKAPSVLWYDNDIGVGGGVISVNPQCCKFQVEIIHEDDCEADE